MIKIYSFSQFRCDKSTIFLEYIITFEVRSAFFWKISESFMSFQWDSIAWGIWVNPVFSHHRSHNCQYFINILNWKIRIILFHYHTTLIYIRRPFKNFLSVYNTLKYSSSNEVRETIQCSCHLICWSVADAHCTTHSINILIYK